MHAPVSFHAGREKRIYVDISTLMESSGPAHGITRLLSKTLADLATSLTDVALCAYDQRLRRFRSVTTSLESLLPASAQAPSSEIEILRPRPPVTPMREKAPSLLSSAYLALPTGRRVAARRGFAKWQSTMEEVRNFVRPTGSRARKLRRAIGAEVDFADGDVLVQWGALWGCHGIAHELHRLTGRRVRIMTLIYDIIPVLRPEFFDETMGARFLGWALASLTSSRHIVAISETTRRDVMELAARYQLRCPATSVIRLGDDSLASPPPTVDSRVMAVAAKPFVLCLGTIEIRKNHRLLYQVWRRLVQDGSAPVLVMVGQRGWLTEETEALFLRDPTLRDHVAIVRHADDAAAAWLLARAMFTVYPSFYEGWGLPVAESLCAGRMVVASDTPAVCEAGQGLALHLPCDDVPQWAHAIRLLSEDAERRRAAEGRIAAHMVRQSWERAALDLAEIITDFSRGAEDERTTLREIDQNVPGAI